MGFGRRMVLSPDVASSVIVGFRIDEDLRRVIGFLDDPAIPRTIIHETCERCPLTAEQCAERAAPPGKLIEKREHMARKLALNQIRDRYREGR